ncbi:hypothetical protein CkaCkLH20_01141 [Colletotrichum karsti]|uniref:Polarity defective-2 n=1 Tax=Colletotrichum karsti TaxID=1095194 RepID=A0A9P6IFJ1_9PEZI|nr:uncharacterized protein CkaCkLH20_01141 [Colletotrichum karsti]KAF9880991.1 hypothetical protein CkaCkLH20_01141 [Colletotrichum karsti]
MAPVAAKTSFKSYEAQARLLRAIVAAHPEIKWNYKDIRTLYGSDMTKDMLDHRFKAIRAHVDVVRDAVAQGVDCANIPADLPKGRKEIAKFFGESTADGIQFQFRGIKKDAEALKQTANSGGNPATALNLSGTGPSSAVSTPRKPTPSKPRASGGGRSTAKKTKPIKLQPLSDDDEEDENVDYNALEDTPSKSRNDRVMSGRITKASTPSRRSNTPSRAATIAAAANISQAAAVDLTTSDSEINTPENTTAFEPIEMKPAVVQQSFEQFIAQPVAQPAFDAYVAPSSLSQQSSNDFLFNNSLEDPLASFADTCSGSFDKGFTAGYMDNDGIGEI